MSDRPRDRRSGSGAAPDEVERLLVAAFADRPVPELSGQFDARLRRRLEVERERIAKARRRWRWLLAAYWLGAMVGIGALVERAGLGAVPSLPSAAWVSVLAALALTVAGIALPLSALAIGWSRTPGLPRRFSPRLGP